MQCINYRAAKKILDAAHASATPEAQSAYRFLKDIARAAVNREIRIGESYKTASDLVWDHILFDSGVTGADNTLTAAGDLYATDAGADQVIDAAWTEAREAAQVAPIAIVPDASVDEEDALDDDGPGTTPLNEQLDAAARAFDAAGEPND